MSRLYHEIKAKKERERNENLNDEKNSDSKNTPYILDFYKKKLDDKNYELMRLKHRFTKLQSELARPSKEKHYSQSNVSKETTASTNNLHLRSKSHRIVLRLIFIIKYKAMIKNKRKLMLIVIVEICKIVQGINF